MINALKRVAVLLAAALTLSGCTVFGASKDEKQSLEAIAVATMEAKDGSIVAASAASGQIEPVFSIYVTAKISGRVVAVHHEMGDTVKAGDLLVSLDDADASAQLAQAGANVAQAEAQAAEADRQYKRLQGLLAAGAVSKSQVEQVETQRALAQAGVTAARATLEMARTNYDRTRITAPQDGVLAMRNVEPGTMIGTSAGLFQLVDLSSMIVRAGVAERDVNLIRAGADVPVVVPALGKEFTGKVESISPNMDRQSRSYQVRITLPNKDGVLKGGMFAQVKFPVAEQKGILLPVGAVIERNAESFVFLVKEQVAHQQKVKVLGRSEETVAVEGIQPGDQVVIQGQNRLFDGAPVKLGGTKTP